MQQMESKLLEDFIRRVWIAQDFAQVPLHRAAVALKQLLAGSMGRFVRTMVGTPNQRPQRRDQAEPIRDVFKLHEHSFGRLGTSTLGFRHLPSSLVSEHVLTTKPLLPGPGRNGLHAS